MHHADQTVAKGRADTRYKPDTKEPLLFARPSSRSKATGLYIMGYVNPKGARRDTSPQGLITKALSGARHARRVTGRKSRQATCRGALQPHPRESAAAWPDEEASPRGQPRGTALGGGRVSLSNRWLSLFSSFSLKCLRNCASLTPCPRVNFL